MSQRSLLLGLALSLLQAAACSSSEAEADKAKSPANNEKRDTAIVHEPCDGNSAEATKVDVKGNGKFAITHVMKAGKEVCRIVDLNMDGAPDVFIYYDDQGRERRREEDFDRDGRADEISVYENGQIKLKMRETNFDNQIDTWDYYENGRLVKRERDSNGDGVIDQWWQFNNPQNPKCAIVASDRNGDGKPDPNSVVDLCGESYGAIKTTGPGAPAPGAPAPGAPPAAAVPAPGGSAAPAASAAASSARGADSSGPAGSVGDADRGRRAGAFRRAVGPACAPAQAAIPQEVSLAMSQRLLLVSLVALPVLCGGAGCSSESEFKAKTPKVTATKRPDGSVDDHSMCEWKGKPDREASEVAGPGSIQPNVRRVYQVIGSGEDRHKVLICREIDTNFDGVKDVVRHYNEKGESIAEEADSNYDGKIDTWITFVKGRLAEVVLDTNFDGKPDEWKFYQNGKLIRVERDTKFTGKPDVWEIYHDGHLERMGVDVDGDEHVDRWDHDTEMHRRFEDAERKKDEEEAAKAGKKADAEKAEADKANEAVDKADEGKPKPPPESSKRKQQKKK